MVVYILFSDFQLEIFQFWFVPEGWGCNSWKTLVQILPSFPMIPGSRYREFICLLFIKNVQIFVEFLLNHFLQREVLLFQVFCYCQFGWHVSFINPYFFSIFLYWLSGLSILLHLFLLRFGGFGNFHVSSFSLFILFLENKESFQIDLGLPFKFASLPVYFWIVFFEPWKS